MGTSGTSTRYLAFGLRYRESVLTNGPDEGQMWKSKADCPAPRASASTQTAMPTRGRRNRSPMMRASPKPAIGAAKNSPKPMCLRNETSVCR